MNLENLCLGCMTHKGISKTCPQCGFNEKKYNQNNLALPIRSLLKNRYLIGKTLGSGGFGITYIAWDQTLEVAMAIKEYIPSTLAMRIHEDDSVRPNSKDSEKPFHYYMSKFLEEARTLAKLSGEKGIVSVQDVFKEHGTIYIVMYYVSGINLETYVKNAGGKLEPEESLEIMKVIMDSLSKVHKKALIHRDISPDNIYITEDKQVKLLDFGAARYTLGQGEKTLSIILKRGYTPLEQYLEKGQQGPWTDVYSVGATLYKIMTGKKPKEALDRIDKDTLKSPKALGVKLDFKVDIAIMKALALRPEDRFQSMEAFLQALNQEDKILKAKRTNYIKAVMVIFLCLLVSFSHSSSVEIMTWNVSRETNPWSLKESLTFQENSIDSDHFLLEDFVGQNYEKALKTYDDFPITIEVSEYIHSPRYDENIIVDQFPQAGTKLKSGDLVKVSLSKGPLKMPDFKDKSIEDARTFARDKLFNIILEYEVNEAYEPGSIIGQTPKADTLLTDQLLTLTLAKNPEDIRTHTYENNQADKRIDSNEQASIESQGMTSQEKETDMSLVDAASLYLILNNYDLSTKKLQGHFEFNRPLTKKEEDVLQHSGKILYEDGRPVEDLKSTFYADYEGLFVVNFLEPLEEGSYNYILGIHIHGMTYNLKLPFEVK